MRTAFTQRLQNRIENHRKQGKEQDKALLSVLSFFHNTETHGCFLVQDESGAWVDPINLHGDLSFDEMSMEAFSVRMDALFHNHLQAQRLTEFTQDFVKLRGEQRAQVIEEHADAFKPHRLEWFANLSDRDCNVLKQEEGINIYFHLIGDYDINGVTPSMSNEDKYATSEPSFGLAA